MDVYFFFIKNRKLVTEDFFLPKIKKIDRDISSEIYSEQLLVNPFYLIYIQRKNKKELGISMFFLRDRAY
jgi:hypothetical protein